MASTAEKRVSVRLVAVGGDKLKADFKGIGAEGDRAMQQIARSSKSSAMAVQNASYQVGDFFVQVASGTPVMRAAAQQLPQLLGGIGMWGAIAGAAVPIGIVLYSMFGTTGEKAKTAEERIKELTEAVDGYASSTESATQPMVELIAKYGELAGAVRELRFQEAELARGRAVRAVAETLGGIGGRDALGGFTGEQLRGAEAMDRAADALYERIQRLQSIMSPEQERFFDFTADLQEIDRLRSTAEAVRSAVASFADEMGISTSEGERLAIAFANVEAAATGSVTQQIAASQALVDTLVDIYGSIEAADQATGGLVGELIKASQAAADVASVDMETPIAGAAGVAGVLAANLRAAANAWIDQQNSPTTALARQYELYGMGRKAFDEAARDTSPLYTPFPVPKTKKGGGGMSEAAKAERDALKEVDKLYQSTRTDAEKFAEEQARINELFASGHIDAELQARGIAMLEEKYLGITSAAEFFEDIQKDAKEAILDFATTGEVSFDSLAASIKRAAAEYLLFGEGPFASLFGGSGGFSGLLGGILSFDGGGWTGAGARSGGLDGRGGFMAMLHPREIVHDTTRGGSPVSGGVAIQASQLTLTDGGEIVATVRAQSANDAVAISAQTARAQQRAFPSMLRNARQRGTR